MARYAETVYLDICNKEKRKRQPKLHIDGQTVPKFRITGLCSTKCADEELNDISVTLIICSTEI
jgi:hypothetical protein